MTCVNAEWIARGFSGQESGSSTAGPGLLMCGVRAEEKDIVAFMFTFLW